MWTESCSLRMCLTRVDHLTVNTQGTDCVTQQYCPISAEYYFAFNALLGNQGNNKQLTFTLLPPYIHTKAHKQINNALAVKHYPM